MGTFSQPCIAADGAAPQACSDAECPAVTVGTTWVCLGLWGDALGKAFLNSPGSHSGLFDSHFGAYNRGIQSVTKSSLYAVPSLLLFCYFVCNDARDKIQGLEHTLHSPLSYHPPPLCFFSDKVLLWCLGWPETPASASQMLGFCVCVVILGCMIYIRLLVIKNHQSTC